MALIVFHYFCFNSLLTVRSGSHVSVAAKKHVPRCNHQRRRKCVLQSIGGIPIIRFATRSDCIITLLWHNDGLVFNRMIDRAFFGRTPACSFFFDHSFLTKDFFWRKEGKHILSCNSQLRLFGEKYESFTWSFSWIIEVKWLLQTALLQQQGLCIPTRIDLFCNRIDHQERWENLRAKIL